MNFNIEIIKNTLAKIKYYNYTQIEIPYFNEIINTEFLGFNHLDYNFRLAVIIILSLIFLKIIFSLITNILYKCKTHCNKLFIKYKSSNETHFNLLISNKSKTIKDNINLFAVICYIEIEDKTIPKQLILNDFTKTFLVNQTAKIKYEENNIIFVFENFYKKINSVITQLYITKEILTKKYPKLKIYIGASNLEKNSKNIQIQELIEILKEKVSDNFVITTPLVKFYYDFVSPKQYVFNTLGHSFHKNKETELYAMISQVAHI